MSREPVKDTQAMIQGMSPVLDPVLYHFCTSPAGATDPGLLAQALASFAEEEGLSLILTDALARAHGFATDMPMQRITLNVYSALDGVGLTAAVAVALAKHDIPCNMVAGYHHDHAFVPAAMADHALEILLRLAGRTA